MELGGRKKKKKTKNGDIKGNDGDDDDNLDEVAERYFFPERDPNSATAQRCQKLKLRCQTPSAVKGVPKSSYQLRKRHPKIGTYAGEH